MTKGKGTAILYSIKCEEGNQYPLKARHREALVGEKGSVRKGEYIPEQQAEQRVLRPVGPAVVRTLQRKGVFVHPPRLPFARKAANRGGTAMFRPLPIHFGRGLFSCPLPAKQRRKTNK